MLAALSSYVNSDTLSQVGCWGLQCGDTMLQISPAHYNASIRITDRYIIAILHATVNSSVLRDMNSTLKQSNISVPNIFTFIHQKAGSNNRKAKKDKSTKNQTQKHRNTVQRVHKVL